MAGVTIFSYTAGTGPLHGRDPRVKLAALLVLSVFVFSVPPFALFGPTCLLLVGWIRGSSRQDPVSSVSRFLRRVRPLLILGAMIVVSRGVSITVPPTHRWAIQWNSSEAFAGLNYAVRFILVGTMGDLFLATTSRGRIVDTVTWLCRPLPKRARALIPFSVAIALSSAPILAGAMQRTKEACTVRGVNLKRSPRLVTTAIARSTLDSLPVRLNRIADAAMVRGFSFTRTPPHFQPERADLVLTFIVVATIAVALFILTQRPA